MTRLPSPPVTAAFELGLGVEEGFADLLVCVGEPGPKEEEPPGVDERDEEDLWGLMTLK